MAPSARLGNLFQALTETPSDEGARFSGTREERLPDLHEVDMMNPVSFFVEVDLFLKIVYFV